MEFNYTQKCKELASVVLSLKTDNDEDMSTILECLFLAAIVHGENSGLKLVSELIKTK